MATDNGTDHRVTMIRELCKLPRETEWVEFKVNNADPDEIGEYISALSNSAVLSGQSRAFLIWGVEDGSHRIVGTTFHPASAKKGNEPLETWLLRLLKPEIDFQFHDVTVDGHGIVLLEIERAYRHPVRFKSEAYLRIGSVKKPIKDAPEHERRLWSLFDATPFEHRTAKEHLTSEDVLALLDYGVYFKLLGQPAPEHGGGILDGLASDGIVRASIAGGWDITNLGAILFARRLKDFGRMDRKAMRVIQYPGNSRTDTIKETPGTVGYAIAFERIIRFLNGVLPSNEVIGQALRETVPMYPQLAVREVIANALIHQDLFVTGAGPMVEIFSDRIEITNPGEPLVDIDRFLDSPPKSRNEALAALMRRFGICEERGSGIDKVITQIEAFQLPAPLFETYEGSTRIVLFAHKDLKEMERSERVRATYLHACLRYVLRQPMSNATLRQRFGIEEQNAAQASRILNEAIDDGMVVVQDSSVGTRSRRYLPFWAVSPGTQIV